ncbi:MAG: hypothetical protein AAGC77_05665, partial [Pseudomonadota bacterium]
FTKSFRVSEGLRELPNTDLWEIASPLIGSRDDIKISFDRPFDSELLLKHLKIISERGERVPGEMRLADNERAWFFKPKDPWNADKIHLVVSGELEDVAGNNFRDLLDHSVEVETLDVSEVSIPIVLKR